MLFKNAKKQKATVLANNNVDDYKSWDGKTLIDLDAKGLLVNVSVGEKLVDVKGEDTNIKSLIVETTTKRVVFPFSRSFDDDDITNLATEDYLTTCQFYINRKMVDGDEEGAPTGAEYICFGKPSNITFDTESDLVAKEPNVKTN